MAWTGGNNPMWGRDPGVQPSGGGPSAGAAAPAYYTYASQPSYCQWTSTAGYAQTPPHVHAHPAGPFGYHHQQQQPFATSPQGYGASAAATFASYPQPPSYAQPYPYHQNPARHGYGTVGPQPLPFIDETMPAANMTNSTGGTGCEPGYNYFFPAEHTKMHRLEGTAEPWKLPPHAAVHFRAHHVPVNTTIGDLLKGFGATNPVPKKNVVSEVVQGGNGRWYRGLTFSGDMKDDMAKPIKQLGWDRTRTGQPGQKPVVYIFVQRG